MPGVVGPDGDPSRRRRRARALRRRRGRGPVHARVGRPDALRLELDPPEHVARGHGPARPRREGRSHRRRRYERPVGRGGARRRAERARDGAGGRPRPVRSRASRPPTRSRTTRASTPRPPTPRRSAAPRASPSSSARARDGFTAAGAFETIAGEIAVANTEGQFCWAPTTQASVTTVVTGGDGGNGFAEVFARSVGEIDARTVGERANAKAVASQAPRDLDAGRYIVVLEPSAVSTLVGFLAYIGFGGRQLAEGRSPLSQREGSWSPPSVVTIVDDAAREGTLGIPFDFEGVRRAARPDDRGRRVPRRRVRPPHGEAGGHGDDRARAPGPEPGGTVPAQRVDGAGGRDARGDDRVDRARAARDAASTTRTSSTRWSRRSPA